MSEVKYRHPQEHTLTWSGRGRQPKWVDAYLANGGSLVSLDVVVQARDEMVRMEDALEVAEADSDGIDLGIGEAPAAIAPTFGETLYAQRIVAGVTPEPAADDPTYSAGTKTAVGTLRAASAATSGLAGGNSNTHLDAHLEIGAPERALAEYLGIDITASAPVLLARAKQSANRSMLAELEAGIQLLAAKGKTPHGEFGDLLAEQGYGVRAAQQAMRWAQALASEGDARRRKVLLEMGKTNAVALLAAKPEIREQILSDPDLAQEAAEASKLELQALLKEKELQIERHQKAYADLETQLEIRNLEMQRLTKVDPVALLTRSVRAEAVANAAAIGELCDNLVRLADAVMDESIAAEQREVRERAVGAAVGSAMAHLQALYTALEGHLEMLPKPTALDDLTQDEISQAVKCRTFIEVQFGQRLAQRRDEAYAEHLADGGAKRRGRPPKKAEGK